MTRFFWKYRYINFFLLLFAFIFCCLNITKIKVFFDSERIIELSNVEKDIIEKSVDDSNLLLVGLNLIDSLNYVQSVSIDSILDCIDTSKYIKSVKSIFNERIILKESILPFPVSLFNFQSEESFENSLERITSYNSKFISKDFKKLIFIIKCKNLETELQKSNVLEFLNLQFSKIKESNVNITGQIKSEIYMTKNVIKELMVFITLSAIICSLMLFFFVRNYKIVFICLLSILFSIMFSISISTFLFGGIELVMIIIPAIIFIINISDFMHLLNINKSTEIKYKLFYSQLIFIGKPVFLTSLTTAIGFLSFTFGSFEPLTRFGIVTTLSIFVSLFIIVTFFALIIDLRLPLKSKSALTDHIVKLIQFIYPHRKIILILFLSLSFLALVNIKINNYITDEINTKSKLYKEINFIEENFGGIKPISFTLFNANKDQVKIFNEYLNLNKTSVDITFTQKDTTLIKSRIRDIGSLKSNILYNRIIEFSKQKNISFQIGGVGYLFDQISRSITIEILVGLILAILLIGFIFVILNNFNLMYLFISLTPNLVPLFSCLGLFSLFGFYLSLSNAFIFAIVFGLIVDDSIHIISAYSISRKQNHSISKSIEYCKKKTFHAIIKTTVIIIISLLPLLFSEFRSISQLASITITAALIALVFDILFLPNMLQKYIR